MTAPAHSYPTLDDAYEVARRLMKVAAHDAESVRIAIDVLQHSTNPTDIAAIRWSQNYAQPVADMAQVDQDDLVAETVKKLRLRLYYLAVIGGVFGGTAMEWAFTAMNGGAM